MTSDHRDNDNRSGLGGGLAMAGFGLLMVLCCAGPVLLAGGALGALGGALRSPWLIAAGVIVVLATIGYPLWRRTRYRADTTGKDCCPPAAPQKPRSPARPDQASRP